MKGKVTNQEIEAKMNNLQEQLESFGNALGGILLIQQEKKQEITPVQQKKAKDSWNYQKQNRQWAKRKDYEKLEREMNETIPKQQENYSEKPLENFSYDVSEIDRIAKKYSKATGEQQEKPQKATEVATGEHIQNFREMKEYFEGLKEGNKPLAKQFISWATGELLK